MITANSASGFGSDRGVFYAGMHLQCIGYHIEKGNERPAMRSREKNPGPKSTSNPPIESSRKAILSYRQN